jgi:hypothetical protein
MNQHQPQRQFFRSLGWIALLAGALGLLKGPTVSLAAGAPQVSVSETTHDFGKMVEDQPLTHTFEIKNRGGAPLRVEDVDPDCACTAADYDHTIPPGGQGQITLTIRPYSVMHQFLKHTRVRFNDPETPLVVFTLKGVAQPFIEIQPSHIVRLRGAPGDDLEGQVRFTSHLAGPWKITGVRNNIPDKIDVSLQAEVPDKVYVLTVKNKRRDAGAYGGVVELFTTSKQRPRLIVRVFGELYLPSAGRP